jgi:ABC-type branched-subunit amino acid transport system ATPase component
MPEPLLRLVGLTKDFGGVRALDGVSLEVHEGEILGLIGPNGSGKTTLVNVVTGVFAPSGGAVYFRGRRLEPKPWLAAHVGIARTFQSPRPFARLTVFENVLTAAMFRFRSRLEAEREAARILELLDMGGLRDLYPRSLTIEQRKRLDLARTLAIRPSLLFLDELMAGLNPGEMAQEVERVRELNRMGVTVVYIEHVMKTVRMLCQRVVVLHYGRLLTAGPPDEVLSHPDVVRAYLGGGYRA